MSSYVSPESHIPPLRPIPAMVPEALVQLDRKLYASRGRLSIHPERLLLQVLYTIRSERLLVE